MGKISKMDDTDLMLYDHIQGTHVNCCLRNYLKTYYIISQDDVIFEMLPYKRNHTSFTFKGKYKS